MDVYDFLGNLIKEGDQIVWPNRRGSSMWMNRGWVRHIGYETAKNLHGVEYTLPVLQVDRDQGDGLPTKKVEIYRTERVVALGRHPYQFTPRKAQDEFRETWLDRVMAWIRSKG